MKKYIIGFVVALSLSVGGYVSAKVIPTKNTWYEVDKLKLSSWDSVTKTYDEDANVICYVYIESISCLKNN